MFLHLHPCAPQVREKTDVIAGTQNIRINQPDHGHDQHDLENRPHKVIAVIEQCRRMKMHTFAADELPERARIGQATGLPETEQPIGNDIGDEKECHTEAAIEVEQTEEPLADRRDHPAKQVLVERCENIHERLPPFEASTLLARLEMGETL